MKLTGMLYLLALIPLALCMPFDQQQQQQQPAAPTPVAFSDALGRTFMLPLAAAAYSTDPSKCLAAHTTNGKLKRRLEVDCDKESLLDGDKCSGFSATAQDAIILAFRGTNRGTELLLEADETMLANHTAWVGGGTVSKYFNDAFMKIWNHGMKDDFSALASANPKATLYITGHSLGAALASLCASYIAHLKLFNAEKIILYNFGQPRTGNKAWAQGHDIDVITSYRITHGHDLVAHLPYENWEGYYHHKAEVYYHKSMAPNSKYFVCSDIDESTFCSDGNLLPDAFIKGHLTYYEHEVQHWGEAGCN